MQGYAWILSEWHLSSIILRPWVVILNFPPVILSDSEESPYLFASFNIGILRCATLRMTGFGLG